MINTTVHSPKDSVTPYGKLCQKIADYKSALIILKRLNKYDKESGASQEGYTCTVTCSQIEGEIKRLEQLKTDFSFGFLKRTELESQI